MALLNKGLTCNVNMKSKHWVTDLVLGAETDIKLSGSYYFIVSLFETRLF